MIFFFCKYISEDEEYSLKKKKKSRHLFSLCAYPSLFRFFSFNIRTYIHIYFSICLTDHQIKRMTIINLSISTLEIERHIISEQKKKNVCSTPFSTLFLFFLYTQCVTHTGLKSMPHNSVEDLKWWLMTLLIYEFRVSYTIISKKKKGGLYILLLFSYMKKLVRHLYWICF